MACGVNGLRRITGSLFILPTSCCRLHYKNYEYHNPFRLVAHPYSDLPSSMSKLWKPWTRTAGVDTVLFEEKPPDFECSNLLGRDLVDFANWTREDIFTLLWIALDLKVLPDEIGRTLCNDKSIVFLYEDLVTKTGIIKGVGSVGALSSTYHVSHLDKGYNLQLLAKSLASECDAIFIESSHHTADDLDQISIASSKPVINIRNKDIGPLYILAELLTLYEHYGYLRRLNVSYIGHLNNPLMKTYITLLPKIGMHFRYTAVNDLVPDDLWAKGVKLASRSSFKTNLHHVETLEDAIFRAHVIVTNFHKPDGEGSPDHSYNLSSQDMEEAQLNWVFFHHDVQKGTACTVELLRAKQCLVWLHLSNLQWIAKAALVALTRRYSPTIRQPGFQGIL